jgi:glycosyltransferase involved in cell wall biosynthesis
MPISGISSRNKKKQDGMSSATGAMIFHNPQRNVISEGISGSWVHSFRMFEAFGQLGFEIEVIEGTVPRRKQAIERLKREIERGRTFDFLFSEPSTHPMAVSILPALTSGTHIHGDIADHFLLDWGFFKWLKDRAIPRGLFYGDIHWKYDIYRNIVSRRKLMVTIPLYWYDWLMCLWLVDHLYIPSMAMHAALPTSYPLGRVSALFPGCVLPEVFQYPLPRTSGEHLTLFYVGGITPPLYDLRPMFRAMQVLEGMSLTICCREQDWKRARSAYEPFDMSRVHVVHKSGSDLVPYYTQSDIFLMGWDPVHPYLHFAMPVKVFEALGYGLPIVTVAGTSSADFIVRERIGWAASTPDELPALLRHLQANPHLLNETREQMETVRAQHTWKMRARMVVDTLLAR